MPVVTMAAISAVFQRQVKALKPGITALSKQMGVVREKSKDLAPKVIGLYDKLKAEYAGLSFVDYVRMFDASVATHAADRDGVIGYRNNPTYYAMDYMRRSINLRPRGRQGVRDSATDALARTLATILQVVPDAEPIWSAVQDEFKFGERLMNRLRKRVEDTKPLINLKPTKPVHVGNVIHMEPTRADEGQQGEAAAGAFAQRGRRVKVAA